MVQIHSPRPLLLKPTTYSEEKCRRHPGCVPRDRWFKCPRPTISISLCKLELRNCAEIILHWSQRVVPLRLRLVPGQRKVFHFLSRYLFAFFVFLPQQTSTHLQSRQSRSGANVVEGRLKALQGLARPILADLAEQTVFDRIPFRGARGIVADRDGKSVGIYELLLQMVGPATRTNAVAAARVGQD